MRRRKAGLLHDRRSRPTGTRLAPRRRRVCKPLKFMETAGDLSGPLADIGFALKHGAALSSALDEGLFGDLTMDVVEAVLAEAGRLAGEVIAPTS